MTQTSQQSRLQESTLKLLRYRRQNGHTRILSAFGRSSIRTPSKHGSHREVSQSAHPRRSRPPPPDGSEARDAAAREGPPRAHHRSSEPPSLREEPVPWRLEPNSAIHAAQRPMLHNL